MAKDSKRAKGLGRGLSALMSEVPNEGRQKAEANIAIELIHPNPDQPRRSFNEDALNELSRSIAEKGIIQPLILRANPNRAGEYEIVAGERRWRASQRAGLHVVPAIVRDFTDTEVLEVAIIENIQRADLNAIDEALGYQQLMDRFGHTQEKLSEALGKSRSHIANLLRLLSLPDAVKDHVIEGRLSAGHARALIGRDNQDELASRIIKDGLSVRDIEKLVKKPKDKAVKPTPQAKDADTQQIERDLAAHLSMKVSIEHNEGKETGKVVLRYKSLEQLDDLLRHLARD